MLRPIEEPGPARKPDRTDRENDDGGEGHQTGSGPPLETALCVGARTLGFLLDASPLEAGDEELALPLVDLNGSVLDPGLEFGQACARQQVVGVLSGASQSSVAAASAWYR